MTVARRFFVDKIGFAVAIIALLGLAVLAQETEEEPAEDAVDDSDSIEEIIVVEPKPGSRRRVDEEYEDPIRAKILKNFYEMRKDEEEFEWRISGAEDSDSRIEWGYDPRDEYRMRNEMDLQELPSERNKPATLFRFKF